MLSFISYLDHGLLSQQQQQQQKRNEGRYVLVSIHPWSSMTSFVQEDSHPPNSPERPTLDHCQGLVYLLREQQPTIVFLVFFVNPVERKRERGAVNRDRDTHRESAVC